MTPLTFTALGTTWWVEIFDEISNERCDVLTRDIAALLLSIEQRFSRFLPDSLISRLNKLRTIDATDSDLMELIALGKQFYLETNGVFNILLGNHQRAQGYDETYSFTPKECDLSFANPITDITVSESTISIQKGEIDLGGFGKGWAIDKIAALLKKSEITEFLINGGGDIYATTESSQPITIHLEHPTIPNSYIGTTTICNQAFAASSPHKRAWKVGDVNHSHIIGEKVADATFVIGKNAAAVDMLATTLLLTTSNNAEKLLMLHDAAIGTFNAEKDSFTTSSGFLFSTI